MRINMVIRGQEHLINTPKHIALQQAFGYATPRYAHLPIIFNEDGTKMSKRTAIKDLSVKIRGARQKAGNPAEEQFASHVADGAGLSLEDVRTVLNGKREVLDDVVRSVAAYLGIDLLEINVHDFRAAGYLPEALINFLSLLGWSPGGDREQLDLEETTRLFDISRVGKTNARFDRAKLLAFNTDWLNRLPLKQIAEKLDDYLQVSGSLFSRADTATKVRLIEICRGFRTFKELDNKCRFLFADDSEIEFDAKAVKKVLASNDGTGYRTLESLQPRLQSLTDWSVSSLEQLFDQICTELDTKLGNVAQPVRVAISGSTVSPPIFETLEILGQNATLGRIQRCLALPR
jgi:glutamyl-tRNA synthetase